MLRVYVGSSAKYYVSSPTASFPLVDGKTFQHAFLFGPFGSDNDFMEINGRIHDGPLQCWGDRSCNHIKWEGTLVLDGALERKSEDVAKYYGDPFRAKLNSNRIFSGVISPGDSYISPELQTASHPLRCHASYSQDISTWGYWRGTKLAGVIYYTQYDHKLGKSRQKTIPTPKGISYTQWLEYFNLPETWGTWSTFMKIASRPSNLSRDEIYSILYRVKLVKFDHNLERIASYYEHPDIYGYLSQKAVDRISYVDTNGLEYFPELLGLKTLISQFYSQSYTSAKALASAYLAFQYGVKNLYNDSKRYTRGLQRIGLSNISNLWKTTHSAEYLSIPATAYSPQISLEYHYKITYRHYDDLVINSYRKLREWGLAPTLTSAWDMVPFSFVVDWFLDIESLTKQFDDAAKRAMYKYIGVTKSRKLSTPGVLSDMFGDLQVVGNIQFTHYSRQVSKRIDVPRFAYATPEPFHNYVEAAALIIARQEK